MTTRFDRIAIPLLKRIVAGKKMGFREVSSAKQGLYLVHKPSPSRKSPAKARKEAKRATHRLSTHAIREAVSARAGGVCECCGRDCYVLGWEMDHWENGIGRRRERQSVENCWALCGSTMIPGSCHYKRQLYIPGVAFWNARFRYHCLKHGYPFEGHIEHASLRPASAAAPHPPRGGSGAGQEEP